MNRTDESQLTGTLAELAGLLDLPDECHDRHRLWETARTLTYERTGGKGHLWAAIGLDYRPCSMGCAFCSFAEPWTAIRECHEMAIEEVEPWARHFADEGADYLILRTSELYPVEKLVQVGRRVRKLIPATTRLIANTSLIDRNEAVELVEAGFSGIYKTIRIREGSDTPFNTDERMANIAMAASAGLENYALVEPVGPEHTAAELAEAAIRLRDHVRPMLVGAMARVPVPGSPLARFGRVSDEFLADLTALLVVTLLPALPECRLICSHPASPMLARAGANAYVCEVGAVPRDTGFVSSEWCRFAPSDAKQLLREQGYRFS